LESEEVEYQCSDCGAGVQSDTEKCPNCGASLEDSFKDDQLIKIPIPSNPSDLSTIQSLLDENKIEYSIDKNSMGSVFGLSIGQPVNLWIRKDKIEVVNKIINSFYEQENVQILDTESFIKEENKNDEKTDHLIGVHGWLLFFCISLIFLSPLINFVSFFPYLVEDYYFLNSYPLLELVTYTDILLGFALMVFGIYVGIKIWTIRPNAIKIANSFLNMLLVYVVISSLMIFLFYSIYNIKFSTEIVGLIGNMFRETVTSVLYVIIWELYLKNSVRVKNTFGV
jgi:DNA-directed RNA polymerase subunit RPC12/RpoP